MPATPRRPQRARRAPPQRATAGKVPGSGGPARGPLHVEQLVDEAEKMLLYGMGREAMCRDMGRADASIRAKLEKRILSKDQLEASEPMALGTVDDYIRRVKDRWLANPLPNRLEARERAIRRGHGLLRVLLGKGDYGSAIDVEAHLRKIEGTEMPKNLEISGPGGAAIGVMPVDALMAQLKKLAGEKG